MKMIQRFELPPYSGNNFEFNLLLPYGYEILNIKQDGAFVHLHAEVETTANPINISFFYIQDNIGITIPYGYKYRGCFEERGCGTIYLYEILN